MDHNDLELFKETMERILRDAPLGVIDSATGTGPEADALWRALEENGFTRVCAAEAHGGVGAAINHALPLFILAGRNALAAPFADTVLTHAVLSAAGVAAPNGRMGIFPPGQILLPHAKQCMAALCLNGPANARQLSLVTVPRSSLTEVPKSEDGAGNVDFAKTDIILEVTIPSWLSTDALTALGAFIRAAQMAGAMQAVLDMTLAYTAERQQFGRPLAKFQAIQHHVSNMACETAAAAAAVELAAETLDSDPELAGPAIDAIATAKLRCGSAASIVAAAGHQAHGALGFTREYALGRFTRRLWQWQDEYGSETEWAVRLGRNVLAEPAGGIWSRISG